MHFLKNLSIRRKQTLIIMLISSVALLLACAAFIGYDTVTFRRELSQRVTILADAIGNNCAAAIDFNDPKTAGETLAGLRADDNIVSACVYSRDGRVFAVYQRDTAVPFAPPAMQSAGQQFTRDELHLFRAINQGGVLTGMIFVASDLKGLSSRLMSYVRIVGAVFLTSLLAALLLSSRLQRLVSDPILQLVRVTRSVAQDKNYSVRAKKQGNDEIGQLVDGFNEMLAQIQERDAALQSARDDLERRVGERTKELAQSLSLLNATLESTADGILVVDGKMRVTSYNSKFVEMWGLSREKIATGEDDRILPLAMEQMKDGEAFLAKVRELYAKPEAESHDLLELKDGRIFERDSQPQRLNGECVGRVWSFRDITRRQQIEATLIHERELLRALLDTSEDKIYFKNAESRFIRCSASLARQFKVDSAEGLAGKSDFDIFTADHARPAFEDEQKIIRTGEPVINKLEKEIYADGRVTWALTNKMPLRNLQGEIIGTFGISKDITTIKETEARLAETSYMLESLLENSPDAIYFKDRESRCVRSSKSMLSLLHMSDMAQLIGKTDFDIFLEEHARPAFADEQEIIRTGQPIIGKLEKETHKDGRVTWALTTKMPWHNKDGQIIGTFGISKDITAIKEAEIQLGEVHKQLLETSRQAGMAEVATNVLHNVGNVLNSVNVSAGMVVAGLKKSKAASLAKVVVLLREHAGDLGAFITTDPKGKQLPAYLAQLSEHLLADQKTTVQELDSLVKNIEHIKEIVAMQQSYARVSGVKEVINVRELVEDSLRINVGALGRHRVEIIREFEDVPVLNIEKHKLLQILVNLIRNAKHACQDSERADKRLTVRVANGPGRVKISVTDNGIGIPPQNLSRIFNHGFTTRKDGHGFGLHSGALAAKEMGGSLTVQSDGPGRGATFTLDLPCATNSEAYEQHDI